MQKEYCAFFNETKHREFNFLSNFYEHPVVTDQGIFRCSEGLYQYLKFQYLHCQSLKEMFASATGDEAWKQSRVLATKIDPKWDRMEAMRQTLHAKFQDPTLQNQLLSTGTAYLVENAPCNHDSFWSDNGDGSGQNQLGIMLMELRKEMGGKGVQPKPKTLVTFYAQKCPCCSHSCHFTNESMLLSHCSQHLPRKCTFGNLTIEFPLPDIKEDLRLLLIEQINNSPALIEEAARLIAKEMGSRQFVITDPGMMAIGHLLRTKYKLDGVLCLSPTIQDKKRVCLELLLSTKLLSDSGATCTIALFTKESGALPSHISACATLPHFFHSKTPQGRFCLYSSCDLPTQYGILQFYVFKHSVTGAEAIACVSPITFTEGRDQTIPVRIHDACVTSEIFYSIKCDCQLQLHRSIEQISKSGGMVIYLQQEGRGIGLANKIAAYDLQETEHLDTVQANRALGLPDDAREYAPVRDILNHFGITSISLMTNNVRKIECLEKLGISISKRIPCIVTPKSSQMRKYMKDKAKQMAHLIPRENLIE